MFSWRKPAPTLDHASALRLRAMVTGLQVSILFDPRVPIEVREDFIDESKRFGLALIDEMEGVGR